jgi:hypothetical protein
VGMFREGEEAWLSSVDFFHFLLVAVLALRPHVGYCKACHDQSLMSVAESACSHHPTQTSPHFRPHF